MPVSLTSVVSGGQAYVDGLNYSSGDGLDDRLRHIGIQKWISMNGLQEDEGWIETRRFSTDANPIFHRDIFVKPAESTLGDNEHPTIWLYPANELSLNPNAPAQRSNTDRVFWDN